MLGSVLGVEPPEEVAVELVRGRRQGRAEDKENLQRTVELVYGCHGDAGEGRRELGGGFGAVGRLCGDGGGVELSPDRQATKRTSG